MGKPNKLWIGVAAMAMLVMTGFGLFAYQAQQLQQKLSTEQSTRSTLLQAHEELKGKIKPLEEHVAGLEQQLKTVAADRDNLLSQVTFSRQDRQQTSKDYRVLREVLRHSATESNAMRAELDPLKQKYEDLQVSYSTSLQDRTRLERELAQSQKTQDRTPTDKEKDWQQKLAKEQSVRKQQRLIHRKDQAAIKQAQDELKAMQLRQQQITAKLNELKAKYDQLNEHHAQLLAENTSMKRQSKNVPSDVARLAQQHERLVRETADMHYNMGVLFSKNKQYYQAVAEFRKVIELRPDDADAHYNLGVIYAEHLPDRAKAVNFCRQYLASNPKGADASWAKQYIATWQAWEGQERLE